MKQNDINLKMNITSLVDMAKHLVNEDEVITDDMLLKVQQSLENLANKGLMSVTILHQSDQLSESLVMYGIDETLIKAFQDGNLPLLTLTKSIN